MEVTPFNCNLYRKIWYDPFQKSVVITPIVSPPNRKSLTCNYSVTPFEYYTTHLYKSLVTLEGRLTFTS